MYREAIEKATSFLAKEGIRESKEELWRRLEMWTSYTSFTDTEKLAAAIISGDFDVDIEECLDEVTQFYFHGGLN